jgi:hypothetical protein
MPQWQPGYGQAASSTSGVVVLLLVLGFLGLIITSLVWIMTAHHGYAAAAVAGVIAAAMACMVTLALTIESAARTKALTTVGVSLVTFALFTGAGPTLGMSLQRSTEQRKFDELQAIVADPTTDPDFDFEGWHASYERVPEELRREGWESTWMLGRVRQATGERRSASVRWFLQEIAGDPDPDRFGAARREASAYLRDAYAAAQSKLTVPSHDGTDEPLRAAFSAMLEDFASRPDAELYVAFTQRADLQPTEEARRELDAWRTEMRSTFPRGIEVIEPAEAFSDRFDARRRGIFVESMDGAFEHVFGDDLLRLVPLAEDESREGKYVLVVHATVERIPLYGEYYVVDELGTKQTQGLTFEFVVHWSFELVGPDGSVRYTAPETVSEPAPDIGLGLDPAPKWAIYAALMDSAYYNYSRLVISRFGLEPPPQRTIFPFDDGTPH